jgi:amino acid transporter
VRIRRLRSGEWIALGAALLLALVLGLNWYSLATPDARLGQHESGIRAIGWFAALLLIVAILMALALAVTTATQRATAYPVVFSVLTFVWGLIATITVAVRLVWQPTLGVGAAGDEVDLAVPAWLALAATVILAYGGWRAMGDERTDSAEALEQTEDVLRVRGAPRPAPPPSTAPPTGTS